MPFPLGTFQKRFDEVCERKLGRKYDLAPLEAHFRQHASGKRYLTAKDVSKVFNSDNTPYAKYWQRPDMRTLAKSLEQKRLYVGLTSSDPRALVQNLLSLFHNIGTTSLLLRFIHPQRFGIFSTPVIHLLQVNRPGTVDLYIAYCDALERWREHFRMPSVAQTEAGLWTYAEITKNADNDADGEKAKRLFENDMWVQRERAAQVIRPFFRNYGRLQLAKILLTEDHILSGKIASEEYERLLNIASMHLHTRALPREKGAAEALIEELKILGYIRWEDNDHLVSIWKMRNRVVHPSGPRPESAEVGVMIDRIERICVPWEKTFK
jgi:hypothetical protein